MILFKSAAGYGILFSVYRSKRYDASGKKSIHQCGYNENGIQGLRICIMNIPMH